MLPLSREPSLQPHGPAYALGEALRCLATEPHHFTLQSPEAPQLRLQLDIEPLPSSTASSVVRYRRTMSTYRHERDAGRISSVVEVDLEARCMVAVHVEGLHGAVQRAEPLPPSARPGDGGHWFDQVVLIDPVASRRAVSTMSWSLEPWDTDDQALWCTHVRAADGIGIESAEGFVITADGSIVGACIRGWATPPPAQRGASPPADTGAPVRRMLEMRSR